MPNGRVELPGWPGLAGDFPALPSGRSSRPGSYGILTDERDRYVLLPRCTEIRLRTNGNVTLETKNDSRPSDWRAACVCDCAKWRVGPIGVRVRHDVEADDDTELSMKFSHVRSMTTPSSLLSRK